MQRHYLIHENELENNPELAILIADIDKEFPPIGYERLIYPYLFIMPEQKRYLRLIMDQRNKLIIPLYLVNEPVYRELLQYSRENGCQLLVVDTYRDWLDTDQTRLIPLGTWQDIDIRQFTLKGNKMRKLRYLEAKFEKSGAVRTEELHSVPDSTRRQMRHIMIQWSESKNNVIYHSFVCMKELLSGTLPSAHRAFLTYHGDKLCSIVVIEQGEDGRYIMDQEFYDPKSAPLGHMEYAIVQIIRQLEKEGARTFSLGLTWYPFPFENHPKNDSQGWAWLTKQNEKKTLLRKIFDQGKTNYQFKKKFGVIGEAVFGYLPPDSPFSILMNYWPVFYQNSFTSTQIKEEINKISSPDTVHAENKETNNRVKRHSNRNERSELLRKTGKLEQINYNHSPLDLMTDSWFGLQSPAVKKRSAFLRTGSHPVTTGIIRSLFPFKHIILTARGRDAEALFYAAFAKSPAKILTAVPWTTTLMHQLKNSFDVIELPDPAVLSHTSDRMFKGEINVEALDRYLKQEHQDIAMVGLEVLSNATGGHPVRLSHIRMLATKLQRYKIPLVLDASRIVRNAVLISRYEDAYKQVDVWAIVRQTLEQADHVVTSLTKDFAVPTGGLIATNDDGLAKNIRKAQSSDKQANAPDTGLIMQAFSEQDSIIDLITRQLSFTKRLQDMLVQARVPILRPAYGHAVVVDVSQLAQGENNAQKKERFLKNLFVETGIRGSVHQVGKQKNTLPDRCIRLAFPLGMTKEDEGVIYDKLQSYFVNIKMPYSRKQTIKSAVLPEAKTENLTTRLTELQQQMLYQKVIKPETERGEDRGKFKKPQQADIAIIGLSGKYPQADNHYDFWNKIQQGSSFIHEVPATRWDHSRYYDSGIDGSFVPHKTCCKFGAFLKTADFFDAPFFNLHPDEVFMMDPQERLAMETTWSCIEDAGYVPAKLDKEVGIFSGVTYNEFQKLVPRTSHSCFINSRIAYFFNFQGPSINVDTGCSSSLTAIDLACRNLLKKDCGSAIVIGTNMILHPDHYTSLASLLSSANEPCSKPFGNDDGWIPAEGVVAILLKPLKKALQDNDHIYAVIKSSRIGHEGKTSWFTAFNPKRQARLIQDNFKISGIHPETISYVEAAANGSSLGDAVELEGLARAFGRFTDKKQFCPIGSVKSNTGHGEAVSALLQLTKVLLQFKSETIFPLADLKEQNPNIRIENSPFYFQASPRKWEPPVIKLNGKQFTLPRRATISSFGGGGNMGHLILEEYAPEKFETQTLGSYFIPLSSKTAKQLQRTIANLLKFFEAYHTFDSEWKSNYTLLNVMFTLCTGRVAFQERVVFITPDLKTLIKQFRHFMDKKSYPNIISKVKEGVVNIKTENDQARVQSLVENQSWHDLAQLWVRGMRLSWEAFFKSYNVRRVPLPTYCFQKQSFPIPGPAYPHPSTAPSITKTATETKKVRSPTLDQIGLTKESLHTEATQTITGNAGITEIFRDIFAKAINIPTSQIDLSMPLDRYGFDSVMVTGIAGELETYFSSAPRTLFFECQTIQEVIDYFVRVYPDEIQKIQSNPNRRPDTFLKPPSRDELGGEPGDDDLFDDMAKAILSNSISAEMILEKLA